jgi:hypothetical protein
VSNAGHTLLPPSSGSPQRQPDNHICLISSPIYPESNGATAFGGLDVRIAPTSSKSRVVIDFQPVARTQSGVDHPTIRRSGRPGRTTRSHWGGGNESAQRLAKLHTGPTVREEQHELTSPRAHLAAQAVVDQACRSLGLPTIRSRDKIVNAAERQQLTYRGFLDSALR